VSIGCLVLTIAERWPCLGRVSVSVVPLSLGRPLLRLIRNLDIFCTVDHACFDSMTVSKSKQSGILYGVFGRFDLAALLRLPYLKFLFVCLFVSAQIRGTKAVLGASV